MKKAIIKRIEQCWPRLCDDIEDNDVTNSTMLIAHGEVEGRKFQIQLSIEMDECEFVRTGFGEVKL